MQLDGQQQYSIGKVQFQLVLDGGYEGLPSEVLDKMLAAAHTGVAQLPMWIDGRIGDRDRQQFVTTGERFAAETTDEDGTIRCTLHFQDVLRDAIPAQVAKSVAQSTIRSCITEALVHSVGAQALNDPYARTVSSQLSTRAFDEQPDGSRSSRTRQHA